MRKLHPGPAVEGSISRITFLGVLVLPGPHNRVCVEIVSVDFIFRLYISCGFEYASLLTPRSKSEPTFHSFVWEQDPWKNKPTGSATASGCIFGVCECAGSICDMILVRKSVQER